MNNVFSKLSWGLLFTLAIAITLLPFWLMLVLSFSSAEQVALNPGASLWVWPLHWENYQELIEKLPFLQYGLNSLFVAVITTVGHVLFAAMAGYAVAKPSFRSAAWVFGLMFLTLMIPPQVNLVPLFFVMKQLGWMNTYWALIVPGLFGAFGIFLYRQWFKQLPIALDEAAMLDGCNPLQRFWHVALPMVQPATVTLAILVFITSWNSLLWPIVVTHSESLRTLPVGLAALKDSFRETTNWALLMAGSTLTVLPTVIVYAFGQKFLLSGLTQGAVKE